MGSYSDAAEFYDLLYAREKDYAAEAKLLTSLIRDVHPGARSILDVGCGTGSHARSLIDAGFRVDGVDLERKFVDLARGKCPEGSFVVGDMTALDLPARYDVVTCLFSAIGYVRTEEALRAALRSMLRHLRPNGVVLVDPWFEPGQLTDGWVSTLVGKADGLTVCRMARTVLDNSISRLEFEYLIGTASGIQRLSEVHELGLFTQRQMERAFSETGFIVERKPEALRTRGIYVGTLPSVRSRGDTQHVRPLRERSVESLTEVLTPRLILRRMRPDDWVHLVRMDSDPVTMATLGGVRTHDATVTYVLQQAAHWEQHGFGWWAAFERDTSEFVGRGGIRFLELEGQQDIEVGYGLLPRFWGRGLATELAQAATRAGFDVLGLTRLIGITLPTNAASRRVLEKAGFGYVRDTVYKRLPHLLYERSDGDF